MLLASKHVATYHVIVFFIPVEKKHRRGDKAEQETERGGAHRRRRREGERGIPIQCTLFPNECRINGSPEGSLGGRSRDPHFTLNTVGEVWLFLPSRCFNPVWAQVKGFWRVTSAIPLFFPRYRRRVRSLISTCILPTGKKRQTGERQKRPIYKLSPYSTLTAKWWMTASLPATSKTLTLWGTLFAGRSYYACKHVRLHKSNEHLCNW